MGTLIKIAIGIVIICFIVMIANILKENSQKSLENGLTHKRENINIHLGD